MDEQDQQIPEESPVEENTEETTDEENPPAEEEIPVDVLRANLTKANQEAARYRTRLREVEKALEDRKTPEQVQELLDALTTERETTERSLLIENVALKFSLPTELASVLQGSTREELETHATTLAKFAPATEGEQVPPGDLNGGLNPGNDNDDASDPLARVRKIKGYR